MNLWKKYIGIILCFAVVCSLPAHAATTDELFNSALQAYVAGKLEEAKMYLDQALQKNPKHERAKKLREEVVNDLKDAGKSVEAAAPVQPAPATPPSPVAAPASSPASTPTPPPAASPATVTPPATEPVSVPPAPAPAPAAAVPAATPAAAKPDIVIEDVVVSTPAPAPVPAAPAAAPAPPAVQAAQAEPPKPEPPKPPSNVPVLRFGSEKPPADDEPSVYGLEVYGDVSAPVLFIRTSDGVDFLPNPVSSPPMMAVDLPGAVDRLPKKTYDIKRGPVLRIRHSQYRTFPIMTARVTVDLRAGSEQPVVEAGRGGIWVRFGGAQPPEALAGAPVAMPSSEAPAAAEESKAPPIEIGPAYAFTELFGTGQQVAVLRQANPVGVKVVDAASAQPMADLPVTFEIVSGDGSLSPRYADALQKTTVKTDKTGVAQSPVAVGKKIDLISLKISAGDPAKFNLIEMSIPVVVTAGSPVHVEKFSGDGQEAIAGEELKTPLEVRVTDEHGNPALGAKIQYSILKGNGRLDTIKYNDPRDNEAIADTGGIARCDVWVLGIEAGEQLVEARLIGVAGTGESVLFTAKSGQRIVSLDFKDAIVVDVIRTLAQLGNMNVIFDLEYDPDKKVFVVPFRDPQAKADEKAKKNPIPPLTIHVVDVTVLEALDMVLESSGLTRVSEGNTVRIIAKERALGRPLPIVSDTPSGGGKFVTHVFKLAYTDAENMQKLLTEFVERDGGQIIADPLTNQLLVTQTADNVKKVADVLERLDLPTARAKETNLEVRRFVVQNVSAVEMADRLANILSGPNFEFTLIGSDLSIKKKGTVEYKTFALKKTTKTGKDKVEEDFIKQTLTLNIMTVNPSSNTLTVLSTREILSLIGQVLESIDVRTEYSDVGIQEFKLRYLGIEEGIAVVKRYLSPKGSFKEYAEIATILVNDRREVIQQIEGAFSAVDRGVKKLAIYKFKTLDPRALQKSVEQELINRLLEIQPGSGSKKSLTGSIGGTSFSMVEAVEGAGPSESWWMVDELSRTLIIYDAPRKVDRVINFVTELDETNIPDVEFKVYTMKFADATKIVTALQNFLLSQFDLISQPATAWRDATLPGRLPAIVTVVEGTNSLLAAVHKGHLDKLDRLIEKLDMSNPVNSRLVNKTMFLKYATATEIRNALTSVLTTSENDRSRIFGFVSSEPTTNVILLVSSPENITVIEDIIQKMDVPPMSTPGMRIKVYQLKNIPVEDALPLLTGLFTPSLGVTTQYGGLIGKVVSLTRTNLVAVATVESSIPMVDEIMANIDIVAPPPPDMVTEVFYLNNAKPSDITGILKGTLSDAFFGIDPATGRLVQRSASAAEGLAQQTKPGARELGLFVRFAPDDRLNALTVVAPPAVMKIVAELVRKLDQRAPQVLIDATILEYSLEDLNQRGINFITQPELLRTTTGEILNPLDQDALTSSLGKLGTEFAPNLLGAGAYRAILNTGQIRVLMEALLRTGKVEVLATPKITALNNKPAVISAGQTRFVDVTTFNSSGQPATSLQEIRALLELTVTPTISNDRSVNLSIGLVINEFTPSTSAGSRVEQTNRSASSSILLGDNQTLVLGGVVRDRRVTQQSAVPFLKDIPVIGNLFRSKRETTEKTELMIFITPRVITNLPEATQVTKDVAKSLQQITPFPVNINTSSVAEIAELSGLRSDIDPEQHFRLSQRIVSRREQFGPYQALEHLMAVPGLTRIVFDDIVYRIEFKVDPNVVSLQELVRIKGITLGMAQKIVEERKVRGIFRSEEEFEALMLGLGMNKGFYDRFLKPVIVVQGTNVGDLSLAPQQQQKLPVAPDPYYAAPTPAPPAPAPERYTPPAPQPVPAPAPTPRREPAPSPPIVVPTPEPSPPRTRSVTPPPTPGQKTTTSTPVSAPMPPPVAKQKPVTPILPPPAPTGKSVSLPTPAVGIKVPEPPIVAPAPTAPVDMSLPVPALLPSVSPDATPEQQGKMDINTASLEDLQKLPGIDEYRAKMIDAYRYTYGKFKSVSDLKQVPDITDEIFEQIKDKVYVSR